VESWWKSRAWDGWKTRGRRDCVCYGEVGIYAVLPVTCVSGSVTGIAWPRSYCHAVEITVLHDARTTSTSIIDSLVTMIASLYSNC